MQNDLENKKDNYKHFVDLTNEDINKFIDELYNSLFVDLSYQQTGILMNLKRAYLYFKINDSTTISLDLFENAYVMYGYMHGNVFVKMDAGIFKKIFNEIIK